MMDISQKKIRLFQTHIFSWWETHKRDLPWRHTRDPYRILISEVMLQQTQVSRVLPVYAAFIKEFPTVSDLASAPLSRVLVAWKGMGYNRRALFLKKAAQSVCDNYNGNFPDDELHLLSLPGVGKYTARAILVFAFNKQVSMVDTNIRQIIRHEIFEDKEVSESEIQRMADTLVPPGLSWEWHQALMDYGASELIDIRKHIPLKKRVSRTKKNATPFRQTKRFIRGKLIDALRESGVAYPLLIKRIANSTGRDAKIVTVCVEDLLREGLIEKSQDDIVSLSSL